MTNRDLVLMSCRTVKPRTKPPQLAVPHELRSIGLGTLQALFDLAPDVAFFVKDRHGRYLAVNQSLLARHGLRDSSDAIGKRPIDICPGDFGRIPTEQDQRVLRTGKPLVEHLELHWYRPREPVWCLTTKLPLRDDAGSTTGIIGFSRDIRTSVQTDDIPLTFAEAIAAFEEDPSVECSPAKLAEQSQLSASQFAKLTRRIFGLTPSQFIVKTRISAGSRHLRDTNKRIAEIAQLCGYHDQSAFTRAFRAATGLAPLEYRAREELRG
jgi:PAS domain S-box-containing protein